MYDLTSLLETILLYVDLGLLFLKRCYWLAQLYLFPQGFPKSFFQHFLFICYAPSKVHCKFLEALSNHLHHLQQTYPTSRLQQVGPYRLTCHKSNKVILFLIYTIVIIKNSTLGFHLSFPKVVIFEKTLGMYMHELSILKTFNWLTCPLL